MKKKLAILVMAVMLCSAIIFTGCASDTIYYYKPTNKVVKDNDAIFYSNAGTDNNGQAKSGELVDRLVNTTPSDRQLDFAEIEYYNFIHFGMNTFTGNEWGDGVTDPKVFAPTNLNTDQWCETLKASGSKGVIITAKHHDGFCLWDSAYTDYDVMSSSYQKDIVKMLSDSCQKYGLKFGVYLSPWDMHEDTYATDAYNDYFVGQMTELMTNYGEIFSVWFDGARGEDVGDWNYDWERYYEVVRRLQPNAVIAVQGPDVRWVGNEAGKARASEWSVVSASKEANPSYQTSPEDAERLKNDTYDSEDKGSRELLQLFKDLQWYPAEVDVSISDSGWFYHDKQKPKKLDHLLNIYYKSVGGNSSLLLNIPPNKEGLITNADASRLKELGDAISKSTSAKVEIKSVKAGNSPMNLTYNNKLDNLLVDDRDTSYMFDKYEGILQFEFDGLKDIKRIDIREDQRYSQRIEYFDVWGRESNGKWRRISENTNVGNRRTIVINPKSKLTYDAIRIVVRQSRSSPVIRSIQFYEGA